jgi:hypothetical protein
VRVTARSGKFTYPYLWLYTISAPAVLSLRGKELANLQNRQMFAESCFAETLRRFGYHFAETATVLLKHVLLELQWLGRRESFN